MTFSIKASIFALASVVAIAFHQAAFAWVSYEVKPGQNTAVTLDKDQQALLYIPNTHNQPLQLIFPEMGITHVVPVAPQDTYYVDGRKFNKAKVSYRIKTQGGQEIASGEIINNYVYSSSISLERIINYSTAYNYDTMPEPSYHDQASSSSAVEHVRGYW